MEKEIVIKVRINDEDIDAIIVRKGFKDEADETLTTIGVLETLKAKEIDKVKFLKQKRREEKSK